MIPLFEVVSKLEGKHEYLDRVWELGIKHLGAGSFATVFQHPTDPNIVVKIVTRRDPAYLNYLNWARKNQRNRYVPKILAVYKVRFKFKDSAIIVFMEKLKPLKPAEWVQFAYSLIGTKHKEITDMLFLHVTPVHTDERLRLRLEDYGWIAKHTADKDLKEIMFVLPKLGKPDLKRNNVLKRSGEFHDQFVFVDPVY